MTHNELLAKIVNYPDTIVFAQYYRALRAVVELHKPEAGWCSECSLSVVNIPYPCPTIQAIERALL